MDSVHPKRHDIAADIFHQIAEAGHTKELDAILTLAQNHYAADQLSQGTVEALALRSRGRAAELWVAAGRPTVEPAPLEKRSDEVLEYAPDPEGYAAQRRAFRIRKARWRAGIGRKGIIHE